MRFSFPWCACVVSLGATLGTPAQNAPEQLCGRDILTTGDAWENVQVERYEFERMLASGQLVLWPQRMAALVSHLRFMERRALLTPEQRARVAIGVQLVAGRTLPSNQFALSGDATGLRAELLQIEAGTALVGEQFPAEQLKPLIPLTHLLAPLKPELRAVLVRNPGAPRAGNPLDITFAVIKKNNGNGQARVAECHAYLVAVDGSDFHHVSASATELPGEFSASFLPQHTGPYCLWIAAIQEKRAGEELLRIDLAEPVAAGAAVTGESMVSTRGGITAGLRFVGAPPRVGEIAVARLTLTRADGQPMKLIPQESDSLIELIAFTNAAQEAIPIRATGPAARPELPGSVEIDFRFRPAAAGTCDLFAETRIEATDAALHFTFPVRPAR
jgi:hypothetical protein